MNEENLRLEALVNAIKIAPPETNATDVAAEATILLGFLRGE